MTMSFSPCRSHRSQMLRRSKKRNIIVLACEDGLFLREARTSCSARYLLSTSIGTTSRLMLSEAAGLSKEESDLIEMNQTLSERWKLRSHRLALIQARGIYHDPMNTIQGRAITLVPNLAHGMAEIDCRLGAFKGMLRKVSVVEETTSRNCAQNSAWREKRTLAYPLTRSSGEARKDDAQSENGSC